MPFEYDREENLRKHREERAARVAHNRVLGDSNRYVFATMPRCPRCDSTDSKTNRTEDGGDGSKTQFRRCRVCNLAFKVVWE